MQATRAARADEALDLGHLLDTRQMSVQSLPLGASLRRPFRPQRGDGLLQSEQELILEQPLGAASEAVTLQRLDDLA